MSKAQAQDLRAKSADELEGRLAELKKTQLNLRFQKASGQLTNTAQFRHIRREIAQIKTIVSTKRAQA